MAHARATLVALLIASSSVISGAVEVDREDDSCTLLQQAKNTVTLSRDEVLGCRELVPLLDGHDEILEHFCAVGLPAGTCTNALNAFGPRPWSADTVGKVCDVWKSAMISQRLTNEKLASLLSRRMSKGTQLTQERLDSAVLRKGGGDASDDELHNNTAPPGKDLTCFSAADGVAMMAQNKKGKPACASKCTETPTTCEMLKSALAGCASTCTSAEKRTLRFMVMFSFNSELDCKCTAGNAASLNATGDGGSATNGTANGTAGNTSATNTTANGDAGKANGTAANGTEANGTAANGTAANGTAADGAAANGTAANRTPSNGTAANGTAANGTAANSTAANGTAANGTAAKDDKAATAATTVTTTATAAADATTVTTTATAAADAAATTAAAAADAATTVTTTAAAEADAAPAADEAQ